MAEKLSWSELRRLIAQRAGVSEKSANAFLNSLNSQIISALKSDKQVKINGLGTFKLQAVAPRKSVNVKTGEEITIQGYNKVVFSSEASVKELVESGKTSAVSVQYSENDPLQKLSAQAEEIVDLLGDLGQSPKEEPKEEQSAVSSQPSVEPVVEKVPEVKEEKPVEEPKAEPEKPVEQPVVAPVEPIMAEEPKKKKKKFHFWRDVLICTIVLIVLLVIGFFVFRKEVSKWIRSKFCNKTEQVVTTECEGDQASATTAVFTDELQSGEVKEDDELAIGDDELAIEDEALESEDMIADEDAFIRDALLAEKELQEDFVFEEQTYKIKKVIEMTPGNRLAYIAKKHYGSNIYWPYIYDANKDHLKDPDVIQIGTKIRVPALTALQKDTTNAQTLATIEYLRLRAEEKAR